MLLLLAIVRAAPHARRLHVISEPEEAPDFERSEHWPFGQEVTIAKGDKWPKHFLEECKDGLKDVFIYEVKKSKGYPGEMGARALYLLRVLMGSESFGDWLFNGSPTR
jgi:hypothetical protein